MCRNREIASRCDFVEYSKVRFFYVFDFPGIDLSHEFRHDHCPSFDENATAFAFFSLLALVSLGVHVAATVGRKVRRVAGRRAGAMPPMPVEIVTLTATPVEQTTEFVASLKSRNSTTIQPEVEGFITRIAVRSGQRVDRGALLFEIDSAPQQAALGSLQSMRPMRESEVEFARQQVERNTKLLAAGAISEREVEQFQSQLRSAEAQLKALDEQIRQQRSQLNYYRVVSPNAGTVGDVPVNPGDRVTRSTVLTTVADNDLLEVYINVPVQQAAQLKVGLPVRLMDDRGQLLNTNRITFVSPSVDTATQSVLAKAELVDGRNQFRSDQFVRAQVVFTSAAGADGSGHRRSSGSAGSSSPSSPRNPTRG